MKYDLLIFDLDGTLADTADDIASSLERTLARMGRPPVTRAKIIASIGAGVRKLIERTAPPPVEPVLEAFLAEYGAHLLDRTRLYPGVVEALGAMPERKVVLSNKPGGFCKVIVDGLGVASCFEAVYGGDSFPERKPDAAVIRRAAGGAGRILMVGDSGVDVQTARNAGIPVCAVTYGYHRPGDLDGADFRIDRFDQLLDLVR